MSGRWTRAEVDEAVAKWNRDLALATQNILELMDDPYYKLLGVSPLEGRTAREAKPILQALDTWWGTLPKLNEVMDSVNVLHSKLSRWSSADELFEIQDLLEGKSVVLTHKTAYTQRGLLTPDEVTESVAPSAMLNAMAEVYARAKALVVRVGEIVTRLDGQLATLDTELSALRKDADSLGEFGGALELLEAKARRAKQEMVSDPISAYESFDSAICPAISSLRKRFADAMAERTAFDGEMASAPARLLALEKACEEAHRAHEERVEKIATEDEADWPLPFASKVLEELRAWLGRIDKTRADGSWQAAKIGLANWHAQCDARMAHCELVARENTRAIARRRELRGLLESLRAKAVDTNRAENEALEALYRRAYDLLHMRPTPMEAAEKLVLQYLHEVRGPSVKSHV